MPESHVMSALKAKRARLAGEIIQAQEIVAQRTQELLTIDSAILLFSPDCNPDMIAPIRPTNHGLFFQYRELTRLAVGILRDAGKPMTLPMITQRLMEIKGLADDKRLRRHVSDTARAGLIRLERRGMVRRLLNEPDQWWEAGGVAPYQPGAVPG
jgi:hypothetical protein